MALCQRLWVWGLYISGNYKICCFAWIINETAWKDLDVRFLILDIFDVLCDLAPLLQFKKHEKHPWKSVTFSKVSGFWPATLLKVTLLHGCFSHFLNCTNGTKSCNASHIVLKLRKWLVMELGDCEILADGWYDIGVWLVTW